MLTKDEVQGMLNAALALKTKPAGKKGENAGQEAIIAGRVSHKLPTSNYISHFTPNLRYFGIHSVFYILFLNHGLFF